MNKLEGLKFLLDLLEKAKLDSINKKDITLLMYAIAVYENTGEHLIDKPSF